MSNDRGIITPEQIEAFIATVKAREVKHRYGDKAPKHIELLRRELYDALAEPFLRWLFAAQNNAKNDDGDICGAATSVIANFGAQTAQVVSGGNAQAALWYLNIIANGFETMAAHGLVSAAAAAARGELPTFEVERRQ